MVNLRMIRSLQVKLKRFRLENSVTETTTKPGGGPPSGSPGWWPWRDGDNAGIGNNLKPMNTLHVVAGSGTIPASEFVAQIGPGVDTALVTIVEQQLHAVALQADIAQAHALLRRDDPSA